MAVSYKKLWKMLIDRDMKKKDLAEKADDWEEYNARCGIHSVNMDILLDAYFDENEI